MEPIISFQNFGFKYKTQSSPTLVDINLDIYPGQKVLILGASGSGKSTLCNCINGLIPFSFEGEISGTLTVCGRETKKASIFELSQSVGTVLQDSDAQFVGLSVGEDIAFAMENICMPRSEMVPLVEKNASIVGMKDFIDHVPFELSGGQKQKVAIAGVFANDVKILIFDEPLAALDPQMGMTAVSLIDDLAKDKDRTILIIEHRLEDVLYRPVDRIILMGGGRIVADMTPDELLKSTLLKEHGIREPLYITAMKYAGCSLEGNKNLCSLEDLAFTPENETKLKTFFTSHQLPDPQGRADCHYRQERCRQIHRRQAAVRPDSPQPGPDPPEGRRHPGSLHQGNRRDCQLRDAESQPDAGQGYHQRRSGPGPENPWPQRGGHHRHDGKGAGDTGLRGITSSE